MNSSRRGWRQRQYFRPNDPVTGRGVRARGGLRAGSVTQGGERAMPERAKGIQRHQEQPSQAWASTPFSHKGFHGPLHCAHSPEGPPEHQASQPPASWMFPLDVHLPVQSRAPLPSKPAPPQPCSSASNATPILYQAGQDLGVPSTPPSPSYQPTSLHQHGHPLARHLPPGLQVPHCLLPSIFYCKQGQLFKCLSTLATPENPQVASHGLKTKSISFPYPQDPEPWPSPAAPHSQRLPPY